MESCSPSLVPEPGEAGAATLIDENRARPAARRKSMKTVLSSPKLLIIQPLPRWVALPEKADPSVKNGAGSARPEVAHTAAFAAGAAFFALDQIIRVAPPFLGALRMRMALKAAVAASRLLRARTDEAGLRDTLHLTRVGDESGVAGRAHLLLRRFAERPVRMADAMLDEVASLGAGEASFEITALLREDLALAERLGWTHPLPLHLAAIHDPVARAGEEGRRIRIGAPGWDAVRHAVLARAAIRAHEEAVMLARRAGKLIAAAGTLRTWDGEIGLALILGDDCVAPWRMAGGGGRESGRKGANAEGMNSDRAARRFCDSLHVMGALRLLTPRATFRLYGL